MVQIVRDNVGVGRGFGVCEVRELLVVLDPPAEVAQSFQRFELVGAGDAQLEQGFEVVPGGGEIELAMVQKREVQLEQGFEVVAGRNFGKQKFVDAFLGAGSPWE